MLPSLQPPEIQQFMFVLTSGLNVFAIIIITIQATPLRLFGLSKGQLGCDLAIFLSNQNTFFTRPQEVI